MVENPDSSLFLAGALIGCGAASFGGMLDYWLNLRHQTRPERMVPGCMLYVIGGLVATGIAALVASFVMTGGLRAALVVGLGVFAAFYLTFFMLFVIWIVGPGWRKQ